MPIPTFPYTSTDDAPRQGYSVIPVWSTSIVTSQSGIEQRRPRVTYPRHKITGLKWGRDQNSSSRVDTLYSFYQDCKGAYSAFAFVDFVSRSWAAQYVGIGTGSTSIFNLPSYAGSAFTIKVNGVTKASPADYSVAAGLGDNGRDRITFVSPPTLGHVITSAFTGRRVFVCRFMQDEMSYESFSAALFDIGFDLFEVKGEG